MGSCKAQLGCMLNAWHAKTAGARANTQQQPPLPAHICPCSSPWSPPQAAQRSSWLSGASVTTSDSAAWVHKLPIDSSSECGSSSGMAAGASMHGGRHTPTSGTIVRCRQGGRPSCRAAVAAAAAAAAAVLTVDEEGIVLVLVFLSIAVRSLAVQRVPAAAAHRPQAQLAAAGRAARTRGVLELRGEGKFAHQSKGLVRSSGRGAAGQLTRSWHSTSRSTPRNPPRRPPTSSCPHPLLLLRPPLLHEAEGGHGRGRCAAWQRPPVRTAWAEQDGASWAGGCARRWHACSLLRLLRTWPATHKLHTAHCSERDLAL